MEIDTWIPRLDGLTMAIVHPGNGDAVIMICSLTFFLAFQFADSSYR